MFFFWSRELNKLENIYEQIGFKKSPQLGVEAVQRTEWKEEEHKLNDIEQKNNFQGFSAPPLMKRAS